MRPVAQISGVRLHRPRCPPPLHVTLAAGGLLLAGMAGCAIFRAEGGGPGAPRAGPPATLNGIRFEAVNGGVNDWGPAVFQVRVTVTNTLPHDTVLEMLSGNCAAVLRVYRTADRSGEPVYDAARGAECYVPKIRTLLPPDSSLTLASAADGPSLDLPPGRYYLSALVTPVGGAPRIELPAGAIDVRRR
jgi:hypothetical protein